MSDNEIQTMKKELQMWKDLYIKTAENADWWLHNEDFHDDKLGDLMLYGGPYLCECFLCGIKFYNECEGGTNSVEATNEMCHELFDTGKMICVICEEKAKNDGWKEV